ncbi:unnamed protein product, partial [Rotaria magnacalcarata]
SDEAMDELHTVILKERTKKTTPLTPPKSSSSSATTKSSSSSTTTTKVSNKLPYDNHGQKSTAYHYDHEALKRQQQSHTKA